MRPTIALVLGGGGSRGIAHIGVLEVLRRENIPVDCIVATSMGAIVGALFAAGIAPGDIATNLAELQGSNIISMNIFSARARQKDIEERLSHGLAGKTFDDLTIPLTVMTVDMLTGQEVAISEGQVIPAVLASCAVPAVFPPVEINDWQLADGGVIDSLATHQAYRLGADRILAVDVYPPLEQDNPWVDPISAIMGFELPFNLFSNTDWARTPGMLSSMWRSFRVMAWYLHEKRLAEFPPDVLLRPEVHNYGSLDFNDVQGPYLAGRIEAENHIEAIKELLASPPGKDTRFEKSNKENPNE
jgi:NTE family protein